jgi:predicted transcriptional regulator
MSTTALSAVSVSVDEATAATIARLAAARHQSADSFVLDAINQLVAREEKRNALQSDAKAAMADYRETGLHVTGDEAIAWISSWGTDQELPAPKCHK